MARGVDDLTETVKARKYALMPNTECYIASDNGRQAVTRIFKNGWFSRFARRENLEDSALRDAVTAPKAG